MSRLSIVRFLRSIFDRDRSAIERIHAMRATFARLSDLPDADEILAGGSLGDIWFSGILGGVPEE